LTHIKVDRALVLHPALVQQTLIAKYDRPVPRYTSYPTAPHFTPAVGSAQEHDWLGTLPRNAQLSLYLHVPFCVRLCSYCGCNTTITHRRAPIERFRDTLMAEIDLVADRIGRRLAVSHVHWGGGTPNILTPEDLRALGARLAKRFQIDDAEIAMEIDPRGLDAGRIDALAECGVRRVSLGAQDFDPEVQAAINRIQPYARVARAVDALRRAGIDGINLDLMYGLPLQTGASVARTAMLAADLAPSRIALFGYAHVPWMKRHQVLLERHPLPDGPERWRQAASAAERLEARGYQVIGLDHFALPDDPLAIAARNGTMHRNFQGYTTDDATTLIGFGPSSISHYAQGYAQNATALPAWADAVATGRRATSRGCILDDDDRQRAAIIERIMCDGAVDLAGFPGDYAAELERSTELAEDGLVRRDGSELRLTERGRPLVRTLAALFDRYLDRGIGRHSRAV